MTYELRRKIDLPAYIDGAFPSDSLKQVVTRELLSSLTRRELRIVKSEISETILAIDRDLEVAKTRAALPTSAHNHRPIDETWRIRVKRMRECTLSLFHYVSKELISRGEKLNGLVTYEQEAGQLVAKYNKRDRRQRFLAQAFADLVADEFGDEKLDDLLRRAAVLADDRCQSEAPAPRCFFDDE